MGQGHRLSRFRHRMACTPGVLGSMAVGSVCEGIPVWLPSLPSCGPTQAQIGRWRHYSPAQRLASQHYWRAKQVNGGQPNGYWTAAQWERLCARTNWRCAYCGEATDQLSPDHIQPLAHGGTNDFSNIAPVCMPCQLKKGSKPAWLWFTPDEYDELMRWLHPEVA